MGDALPAGWSKIELARLYGCLFVQYLRLRNRQRQGRVLTELEEDALRRLADALERLRASR